LLKIRRITMSTTTIANTETPTPTTQEWAIDPSHTQVGFAVKHLMIANVKGRFTGVAGSIRLSPATSQPEVDVAIDASTIVTGDAKRDTHLRSADFLHAEEFPTIRFRSNRLEGDPEKNFKLPGELTIRGVTRPVTLYVVAEGSATDPWGGQRTGYSASATINRKDFGLEWNVALEAGGVLVGDDVRITLETELVRQ
jgi:polyisoprenoid-binding protein YceI